MPSIEVLFGVSWKYNTPQTQRNTLVTPRLNLRYKY